MRVRRACDASSIVELRRQVRILQKYVDTYLDTVWWKRWWFIVQGWPGHGLADRPRRRPWHRWVRP